MQVMDIRHLKSGMFNKMLLCFRYRLDYFDTSVVMMRTEDRSKFFDGLVSLLT